MFLRTAQNLWLEELSVSSVVWWVRRRGGSARRLVKTILEIFLLREINVSILSQYFLWVVYS